MTSYEIIMTPDASKDLMELRDYIASVLSAPDIARSCIRILRKEIHSLSEMPFRIKLVDDEPWHSRGVRRIMVKNFFIYFRIDEDAGKIYILNIIYNKRDQLQILAKMKG